MAGVGRKPVVGTYRTPRTPYRTANSVDSGGVDTVDEIIDITVDQSDNEVTTGTNAVLNLFVLLNGPTAATLQLFAEATDETLPAGSSSSSPGATSEWVLYDDSGAIDVNGYLWVVEPLPAGRYKVVVSALTGSGEVIIRESHSA
jgi:hypothetical protein